MQLVRTAQSKHKINLLALSTEDREPYVVATWHVVLIVCISCVPLNPNTNTPSHSPRRTGGPHGGRAQAPASGALVNSTNYSSLTPVQASRHQGDALVRLDVVFCCEVARDKGEEPPCSPLPLPLSLLNPHTHTRRSPLGRINANDIKSQGRQGRSARLCAI